MSMFNGMADLPTDPEARIILAGEYVLGTLDARTAKAVAAALPGDAGLAALVGEFEAQLMPLVALAAPEAPPVDVWTRIEAASAPSVVVRESKILLRLWQSWAIGASLAAAALAGVAFLPKPVAPVMTTVLLADANQQAWQAGIDSKGGLQLAALTSAQGNRPEAPNGKDYQLWALAPGEKAPVSLGVLPRGQVGMRVANLPVRPQTGMLIMISLEPPGGSPNALPTGPVVFIGRLSEAGPPS
jgi:anti-sigma-K factor RskA